MKQFLITVAGVFAGLLLFSIAVPIVLFAWALTATQPAAVPPASVLVLDLRGGLTDQETSSPFALIEGRTRSVLGIEQVLRAAEHDDRIKGLIVRLPEGAMAPAAADELRLAIRRFRAAGKPVLAHSQGLYADGAVASTYELAAATGEVWMQPGSSFQVTGLARDDIFLRNFFDKHGVKPDYQQRYQYKTAVNTYLYSDYTPAHRESELSWMNSVFATAIGNAAADRGRPPAALEKLIVAGPYLADDARANGLIDKVGEVHDAEASMLARAGAGSKLEKFADYAAQTPTLGQASPNGLGDTPTIAVIGAEGDIMTGTGPSTPNPLSGDQTIRSDDVAKAFYDAIDNRAVRAIVFRVSSPGGSDTASEQILAAVKAAKAAGKPVVVSMGTYGASGGYWISSQASSIVAEPSTLTGSIGVFGGKIAIGDALSRFGVDMRHLTVGGDFADSGSPEQPMTAAQTAAFSSWMNRIYDGFVSRVAEGRRMPAQQVQAIARGRVWTGAQAKALGLVDQLGGFYDAIERAKTLAGLTGSVRLALFNPPTSPLEALRRLFGGSTQGARMLGMAQAALDEPAARALAADVGDARLRAQGATVLAPRLLGPSAF
ncbi:MAG: signal peptide peptidase SppA [Caulobacteraceae bacterium]|nr:signal peptide peptidase SppA [Caulobacteraceae bacterium]